MSEKAAEVAFIPSFIALLDSAYPDHDVRAWYKQTEYPKPVRQALASASKNRVGHGPGIPDGIFSVKDLCFVYEAKGDEAALGQAMNEAFAYADVLLPLYKSKLFVIALAGTKLSFHHPFTGNLVKVDGKAIRTVEALNRLISEPWRLRSALSEMSEPEQANEDARDNLLKVVRNLNNKLRSAGVAGSARIDLASSLFLIKEIIDEAETRGLDYDFSPLKDAERSLQAKIDFANGVLRERVIPEVFPYLDPTMLFEKKQVINPEYVSAALKSEKVGKVSEMRRVFSALLSSPVRINYLDMDFRGKIVEEFSHGNRGGGITKELGEFFTPRHIVNFCVEIVDPEHGDGILDPTFGTGGFLTAAFKHIVRKVDGQVTSTLRRDTIFGVELQPWNVKAAKASLLALGDGHSNLVQGDFFDVDLKDFDRVRYVLMNPPYGVDIPEWQFVTRSFDHLLDLADKDGRERRLVAVMPYGVMTGGSIPQSIAEHIEAIFTLPYGVFKKYTDTKTCVVVLTTKIIAHTLVFKIENDGYSLDDKRAPVPGSDLPEAIRAYCAHRCGQMPSHNNAQCVPTIDLYYPGTHPEKVLYLCQRTAIRIGVGGEYRRLSDIFDVVSESVKRQEDNSDLPYIEIGDVDRITSWYEIKEKEGDHSAIPVKAGDLLISKVRTYLGQMTVAREAALATANGFMVLRPKSGSNIKAGDVIALLRANLPEFAEYVRNVGIGTTYPKVDISDIVVIEIAVDQIDASAAKIIASLKDEYETMLRRLTDMLGS